MTDSLDKLEDHAKRIVSLMPLDVVGLFLAGRRQQEQATVFEAAFNAIGSAALKAGAAEAPSPYLSLGDAAALIGLNKRTLLNAVSEAKRRGKEFDWVLRQGRKRGFIVDRAKFIAWIEKRAGRIGRPRRYNV